MQIVIEEGIQSYQDLRVIYGSDSSVNTIKRRIHLLADAYNLTCVQVSDHIANYIEIIKKGKSPNSDYPMIVGEAHAVVNNIIT